MATRVTNRISSESFVTQSFKIRKDLDQVRRQLSTGLKVFNPSDDPGRAGALTSLQNTTQRINHHRARISNAVSFLTYQENVVRQSEEIIVRAKELAAQAANTTLSAEGREQMATEVFELRDSLVNLANTRYQGLYIYGGLDDDDPPFDISTTFYTNPSSATLVEKSHYAFDDASTELGQDITRSIDISDSDSMRIISRGDMVFQDAINAMEVLGRALSGYRTTLADSDSDGVVDDPTGAGTAYNLPDEKDEQIAEIRNSLDLLENARVNSLQVEVSSIGSRLNRLNQTMEILDNLDLITEESRSEIQDADTAEAANSFSNLSNALQALLTSTARINSLSLLDYL